MAKFCGQELITDLIVIGSGASGATFAKIWTDKPCNSCILLEAGDYQEKNPLINQASYNRVLLSTYWPEFGWQGMSKNDPALNNRNFLWPQTGRLVGGSTAINNMNAVKASQANLKQWEDLLGAPWTVDNIYTAYRELETFIGNSDDNRGTDGPISLLQVPQTGPLPFDIKMSTAMSTATGLPIVQDYNSRATPIGPTATWQVFEYPGNVRSDSTTAFLNANIVTQTKGVMWGVHGRRLTVILRATAQRYILDEKGLAKGVLFIRDGVSYTAWAKKGIVGALGALDPQLLMVSGIGPSEVLSQALVKPIVVLENVGKQITNHTAVGVNFSGNPATPGTDPNNPGATTTTGAFLPDPLGLLPSGERVLQFLFQDGLADINTGTPNANVMALTMFLLTPQSVGQIVITSPDFQTTAVVQYNYLVDPQDIARYVAGFRQAIFPFAAALKAIDPAYNILPGFPTAASSDADIIAFLKGATGVRQTHHIRGGTRMAPFEDGGVVDKFGRVYGTENLMVWSTQSLPFQPDGNNAFTVWAGAWILAHLLVKRGCVSRVLKFKLSQPGQILSPENNPFGYKVHP